MTGKTWIQCPSVFGLIRPGVISADSSVAYLPGVKIFHRFLLIAIPDLVRLPSKIRKPEPQKSRHVSNYGFVR